MQGKYRIVAEPFSSLVIEIMLPLWLIHQMETDLRVEVTMARLFCGKYRVKISPIINRLSEMRALRFGVSQRAFEITNIL